MENSKPGDFVSVKGYKASSGSVSDITVVRLEHDDYRRMQTTALARLKKFNLSIADAELVTVSAAMIAGLETNLFGEKTTEFRDIYRDAGGFHVHRDSGTMEEIYLLRLAVVSDTQKAVAPKAADAKAKRVVSDLCRLPTGKYRHALKFSEGSFESVNLLNANELSTQQAEEAAEVTGKNETFETNS